MEIPCDALTGRARGKIGKVHFGRVLLPALLGCIGVCSIVVLEDDSCVLSVFADGNGVDREDRTDCGKVNVGISGDVRKEPNASLWVIGLLLTYR